MHDVSIDYNTIDKSDILNIWHLMDKNNIKQCSASLNRCLLDY